MRMSLMLLDLAFGARVTFTRCAQTLKGVVVLLR